MSERETYEFMHGLSKDAEDMDDIGQIKSERTRHRGVAFDDAVTRFFIKLPSGRTIFFADLPDGEWDSDADTIKQGKAHAAELQSMLDELATLLGWKWGAEINKKQAEIDNLRAANAKWLDYSRREIEPELKEEVANLTVEAKRLRAALRDVLAMMEAGSTISSEVRVIRIIEKALRHE